MATPRIFISSTYYDLKYVRERLERFIRSYCFDPILFECDDVFFDPNSKLDESCYKEIENCHMMILIVGGRYGSNASDQKDRYEKQYVSITRKEYETARRKGIPVMVFVEQNVFVEYKTFLANKKRMPDGFKYAFVDDARVFDFISILEQGAIKVFDKIDNIEHYISHQIAGMLLSYLKSLQENKSNSDVKNAVDEIKVVSQSMQEMINSIAEKVFQEDLSKYKVLLRKQNESLIDFFLELVDQNINISKSGVMLSDEEASRLAGRICPIITKTIFEAPLIRQIEQDANTMDRYKKIKDLEQTCADKLKTIDNDIEFELHLFRLLKPLMQIREIIESDIELKKYFEHKFFSLISFNLALPF